jgi:hypothetical protein
MTIDNLERRLDALTNAVNELAYAVAVLASDHGDISVKPNGGNGKVAWDHLQVVARHVIEAKPD